MNAAASHTAPADVDGAVQLALHGIDGRFPSFHRHRLRQMAVRLDDTLRDVDGDTISRSRLRGELLGNLAVRLDELSVRSLITVFQSAQQAPAAPGYAAFDAALGDAQRREEIFAELPELERLLDLTAARWLDHVTWVLDTVRADRAHLEERWGALGRLTSVRLGQGDLHRHGRSVAILTWGPGTRLVLKPTVGRMYPALADLLRRLDADGSVFGPVLPERLASAEHEWQRFETPGTFTAESAARYLRRYGRVSALLYAVGATDIHRENVIATGLGPVVIDTETLTSLPPAPSPDQRSAHEVLAREVETGVLRTMLYPSRFLGSRVPLDLSPLGIPAETAQHYEGFAVTGEGSDEIRFDAAPVAMEEVGTELRTERGEHLDPRRYAPQLLDGFAEGFELLRQHRAVLRDVLAGHPNLGFRQVFRATWRYARFLEVSTHPSRLTSRARRLETLRLLTPSAGSVPPRVRTAVRDAEVEALADGDVPYFEISAAGDLHANGSPAPLAHLGRSPAEMMSQWWDRVLDEPIADHRRLLRLALDAAADNAWREGPEHGMTDDLSVPAGPPAVTHADHGRSTTWLSSVQVNHGLYLAPVSTALYEGGGVLCTLWETRPAGSDVRTRDLLARVVAGATFHELPEEVAANHEIVCSPFTGALADAVVDAELALRGIIPPARAQTHLARAADRLPELLDGLGHRFTGELLNGVGGTLTALNRYRDVWSTAPHSPRPLDPDRAAGLHAALAGAVGRLGSVLDAPEAGVAHGNLGRLLGIAEAIDLVAHLTGRDVPEHRSRVAEHVRRVVSGIPAEPAFRDPQTRLSWCRGAAGAAPVLVRLHALGAGGDGRDAEATEGLEMLLDALVTEPPSRTRDLSLCHGAAGHVLALTMLGRTLGRPDLLDHAGRRREEFLERVAGAGWTSGLGRSPGAEGFFVGRSGWDLATAALAHPGVRVPRMIAVAP